MIGEVAITSCSSITGEPFILPQNKSTIAALQAAGFTDAADMACLSGAAADDSACQATPLDYIWDTAAAGGSAPLTQRQLSSWAAMLMQ